MSIQKLIYSLTVDQPIRFIIKELLYVTFKVVLHQFLNCVKLEVEGFRTRSGHFILISR